MRLLPIPKRDLKSAGIEIRRAGEIIEAQGGELMHDSNHDPDRVRDLLLAYLVRPGKGAAPATAPPAPAFRPTPTGHC